MQKLENKTLQIFLDRFVDGLKSELGCNNLKNDQLDIPFIISSLYQSFKNHTDIFKDFIRDLCLYPDYNIFILKSQDDYNGLVDIEINLVKYIDNNDNDFYDQDYPEYNYKLRFEYDTRDYGYCKCIPNMPDYRADKKCCGHGCDATFCRFSLYKALRIASGSWEGDEHDYWDFEDEFYLSDKELDEKKEKEDRERQIEELKNRIEADRRRLAELEGKSMKKKDLKSGMIVMTNNGSYYLVLIDTGMSVSDFTDKDVLIGISANGNIKHKGWMGLSLYNEDMETKDEDYSIFEVLVPNCASSIGEVKTYKSVWKRELTR